MGNANISAQQDAGEHTPDKQIIIEYAVFTCNAQSPITVIEITRVTESGTLNNQSEDLVNQAPQFLEYVC